MPEGLSALSHTCRRALVLLRDRAPTKLICEWCGHLRWVQAGAWENWNGERLVGWLQLQQCTQKNVWLSPVAWQQGVGERDEKWVCAWMCSCYSSQRKLQSSQTVRERGTVRWKNCLLRCHHSFFFSCYFDKSGKQQWIPNGNVWHWYLLFIFVPH